MELLVHAEAVALALRAGSTAAIPGLGVFSVESYAAYEGRNPRTGEVVSVPGKKLASFRLDDGLRAYLNGQGSPPAVPWLAKVVERLRRGERVMIGRVGALALATKAERHGRNPQTGEVIVIPARTFLAFTLSTQLQRSLDGEPPLSVVDRAAVEAMLAKLPATLPRTLPELDAALAELELAPRSIGLVEAGARAEDPEAALARGDDGELTWFLTDEGVIDALDAGGRPTPVAVWTAGMLVLAAVRNVARDGVLHVEDVERVLARLGPGSPFGLADLPY